MPLQPPKGDSDAAADLAAARVAPAETAAGAAGALRANLYWRALVFKKQEIKKETHLVINPQEKKHLSSILFQK